MRVLVTGSRSIDDKQFVLSEMTDCPFDPDVIIHGDGSNVDRIAPLWATKCGAEVETHPVPDWAWEQVGRKAGPLRNQHMVNNAEAVVAIWDGSSPGTKDTIHKAEARGLPLHKTVVDVDDDGNVHNVVLRQTGESDQQILHDFTEEP